MEIILVERFIYRIAAWLVVAGWIIVFLAVQHCACRQVPGAGELMADGVSPRLMAELAESPVARSGLSLTHYEETK